MIKNRAQIPISIRELVLGFVAGFIAVLLFHQPALNLLSHAGLVKAGTYNFAPVGPLHVPQVLSLSFWGGVWGVLFAIVQTRFPRGARYWLCALLFGALLPTLVAWFVVAPMKGQPLAAGWHASRMLTGLIVNGAWGIGTAILYTLGNRFAK